jgi:predicted PurR-regulated permease PerM
VGEAPRRTREKGVALDAPAPDAPAPPDVSAAPAGATTVPALPTRPGRPTARVVLERVGAVLVVWLLARFVVDALFAVALLVGALGVALVLAALLEPVARGLRRVGLGPGFASTVTTLALLAVLTGLGVLVASRVSTQFEQLPSVLTVAVEKARSWLVDGPLTLDPTQVREMRNIVVERLSQATPSPVAGAMTALRVLGAVAVAVFALFFLLKDGAGMWRWLLGWTPSRYRERTDTAGNAAWHTLTSYIRGLFVVATVDAVAIGAALVVLGVPLWLSLSILTFFGALVPVLGATVAGAAAVVATLVLEGARDAAIVLLVVLVVQQLEGNVLHPLIMGKALRLHPLAILVAVTAGALVLGVVGALIAVPLTAVLYSAAAALRADGGRAAAGRDSPVAGAGGLSQWAARSPAPTRRRPVRWRTPRRSGPREPGRAAA